MNTDTMFAVINWRCVWLVKLLADSAIQVTYSQWQLAKADNFHLQMGPLLADLGGPSPHVKKPELGEVGRMRMADARMEQSHQDCLISREADGFIRATSSCAHRSGVLLLGVHP